MSTEPYLENKFVVCDLIVFIHKFLKTSFSELSIKLNSPNILFSIVTVEQKQLKLIIKKNITNKYRILIESKLLKNIAY